MGRPPGKARPRAPFRDRLVLNQWALSLFRVPSFEKLAESLKDEALEGLDDDRRHRLHHAILLHFRDLPELPAAVLLEYDGNITRHTLALNERRLARGESPIVWKYFQYLMLLFTEIYLDRLFRDPVGLLASIDRVVAAWNDRPNLDPKDRLDRFELARDAWPQLNKLAFWSATGSGKTLIMHAHVHQYRHYLEKHGRSRELNRIILLTPNEGLSAQHLKELRTAGLDAQLFDPAGRTLFSGKSVEILDINKLREEKGQKTVAVEAFEGNNLVLVDEGHRGASSGETGRWMQFRNALCEQGFSFEYSATFEQAVAPNPGLSEVYSKAILFNYSYRYFYGDGFGKEYHILNLDSVMEQSQHEDYLVAGLLAFFQQQRVFRDDPGPLRVVFRIERPLWVFVGGSVTATLGAQDGSDIVEILRFLARYTSARSAMVASIDRVLSGKLLNSKGENLFAGRFATLNRSGRTPAELYDESIGLVFNAPSGGTLHAVNLKGAAGEIALRLGDAEPFGVVNVGDDAKLCTLCEAEPQLVVSESVVAASLFHGLNRPDSRVNLLIGSRKFTEGWSSWRVSTMGLMNIGASEGAQIIQLFGRGVRLQGHGFSLKRSTRARLPDGLRPPDGVEVAETLNVFGIHASYMAKFREFLIREGAPVDGARAVFWLPVIRDEAVPKLVMVSRPAKIDGADTHSGADFRGLAPVPSLGLPESADPRIATALRRSRIHLDWYPKIDAVRSTGDIGIEREREHGTLGAGHLALMDLDRVYEGLSRFKAERRWFNLNLPRAAVLELLLEPTWYRLLIPAHELAFDDPRRVRRWEEIATRLLEKYVERFYQQHKAAWDNRSLRLGSLAVDDPNLLGAGEEPGDPYYRIEYDPTGPEGAEWLAKLESLKRLIERRDVRSWEFGHLKALRCDSHLFWPLLSVGKGSVTVSPVGLNDGERQFVEDVTKFHDADPGFFAGSELYLLRNLSRGRGVGFWVAGNFYPDFILWQVVGDRQYVAFVDPKGIRNLPADDPKLMFFETVKEMEARIAGEDVRMSAFILSNTPSRDMSALWGRTKAEMTARNILFQGEDAGTYVRSMLIAARRS